MPVLAAVVLRYPYASLAVRAWLVLLGALGLWALAGMSMRGWEPAHEPRRRLALLHRRPPRERIRQLEEIEHAVDFSLATAFDLHFRLRPHLVRVASHRLAARGLSLEAQPERCRALIGDEAWDLVRFDRPPPGDRAAKGASLHTLRRVIQSLDAI